MSQFWYAMWLHSYDVALTVIYKIEWWVWNLWGYTPYNP